MKVRVFKRATGDGYDLKVLHPGATVQDYLDAMNDFINKNSQPPCRGCDECCWERIPLTSIDVIGYVEKLGDRLKLDSQWPLLDFLKKYAYIYVEGGAVDISLGFTIEGACGFLNQEDRICSSYAARSLVCQSFICMESTQRARELRSELVNTGMDELVRLWLVQSRQAGRKPYVHEKHHADPILEDYPANGFTKKTSYSQVLLAEVCSQRLWNKLIRHGFQQLSPVNPGSKAGIAKRNVEKNIW
ncbi:MAG: YkgJ family cysteine cluster protein [Firmicutes bacterium]|nr:YkgJ family cysteine cluster protein [Bacillota bacterium]MCL5780879.1 YkgJ family cysteine cluster protein [Bacillota bacterium]